MFVVAAITWSCIKSSNVMKVGAISKICVIPLSRFSADGWEMYGAHSQYSDNQSATSKAHDSSTKATEKLV